MVEVTEMGLGLELWVRGTYLIWCHFLHPFALIGSSSFLPFWESLQVILESVIVACIGTHRTLLPNESFYGRDVIGSMQSMEKMQSNIANGDFHKLAMSNEM